MTIQNLADAKKAIEERKKEVLRVFRDGYATVTKIRELDFALTQVEQAETEILRQIDERIGAAKGAFPKNYVQKEDDGLEWLRFVLHELIVCRKIITRETKDNKLPVADPQ